MGNHGATPPPLSPHSPLRAACHGGTGPPAPLGRGDVSPPPEGAATPGGGTQLSPHARRPTPPTACSRRGIDRRAPRQRTRRAQGSHPGTTQEHEPERYGGHALHTQGNASGTCFVACPGKARGLTEVRRPPAPLAPLATPLGRAAHRPPPPRQADPPTADRARRPGLPNDPGGTIIHGGDEPAKKGGPGRGPQAAQPGDGEGEPRRDPPSSLPPLHPSGPLATGAPAPHPTPRQGGCPLFPREDHSAPGEDAAGPERHAPPLPDRLLPRGPRQAREPKPAHNDATRTMPGGDRRTRTGAAWGPRPPWPERCR